MLYGCFSEWRDVISGVPQGSVFCPLLFVIYINGIDDCVNLRMILNIYHTVYSDEDVSALSYLCNLVEWSKEWQMLFNMQGHMYTFYLVVNLFCFLCIVE